MRFRLAPSLMILDDLERLYFRILFEICVVELLTHLLGGGAVTLRQLGFLVKNEKQDIYKLCKTFDL